MVGAIQGKYWYSQFGGEGVLMAGDVMGAWAVLAGGILPGRPASGALYSLTIRFSFPHSACCPIMRHVLCRNLKIVSVCQYSCAGPFLL